MSAYRPIFLLAAGFNWLVAISLWFGSDSVWSLLGMAPPTDRWLLHLCVVFIALFGAAYYWVSRDLARNHALVVLGAVGKVSAFCVALGHALAGTLPFTLVGLATGDLVLAALFVAFLVQSGRAARAAG